RSTADAITETVLRLVDAAAQSKTAEGKPSGKISNRRRRARKKKQARIESVAASSSEFKQSVQASPSHNCSHVSVLAGKRGPAASHIRHKWHDTRDAPLY